MYLLFRERYVILHQYGKYTQASHAPTVPEKESGRRLRIWFRRRLEDGQIRPHNQKGGYSPWQSYP